jgi:broad specificity phosphatase PhoE
VYGFKTFERLTASGHEEPPAAEPLSEVFGRVSDFYDAVVKPLTDAGKNVLVVSHQYALEPLALYLGGKVRPPSHASACYSVVCPDWPASARFHAVPRRLRGCHGPAERQGAVV